ncbi:MAG: SPOR domain-containing protein [Rhizobiaceae bacterium]
MANKVQLKTAGDQEFKDNDPFAELTRIMGFDPRVQPTPSPDQDFEIDLEKELMGMFDPGPDAPSGARYPQENDAASNASEDIEEAFAAQLEQELAGSEDFWQSAREEAPAMQEEAYPSDAVGEGMADVDMDFGPARPEDFAPEAAPRWIAEEGDSAEEPETAQPAGSADRNVYRPVFSAPGYTGHAASEEKAPARQYGAAEAPIFDIRSFKSAAQQYREASPRHVATSPAQPDVSALAPERPRAKGTDPFDILAALGTERALPQRRDPLKSGVAPKPAEQPEPEDSIQEYPVTDERLQEMAPAADFEEMAPAADFEEIAPAADFEAMDPAAYLEEEVLPSDGFGQEPTPSGAETAAIDPVPDMSETTPFLNIRPVPGQEQTGYDFAAADIDRMADALHAYVAPAPNAYDEPMFEARPTGQAQAGVEMAPGIETVPEIETRAVEVTPEIETMEVFEPAVAVTDDLDIPVPVFEEEAPAAPAYDELDEEFEHAFRALSRHTEAVRDAAVAEEGTQPASTAMDIERLFAEELGIGSAAAAPAAAAQEFAEMRGAAEEDDLVFDDSDFLPEEFATTARDDGDARSSGVAAASYVPRRASALHGRGRLLAGVAVGVLLLGGIGAFALSRGGSDAGNGPVVLKADSRPVKVKPKNPGGVSVPNQDNKVYERVEDGAQVAPEQKKLVSSEEKPVDISARAKDTALPGVFEDDQIGAAKGDGSTDAKTDGDSAPAPDSDKASDRAPAAATVGKASTSQDIANLIKAAPKGEDRLAPTPDASSKRADSDVLAVTPHKVRTMIVRADGTMVPREDPAPAQTKADNALPTALPAAAPAPTEPPAAKAEVRPAAPADDAMAAMAKADVKPAEVSKPAPARTVERLDQGRISTPAKVAVAPSRPADQPLDIVGAAPKKVASAQPAPERAPVTAASGDWSVQIASQPTAEAAQTSYQNMARRHPEILGGHAVNIVKADIEGKGTYYRVRVTAGSKDDAIALCTKYKAAGGSCFVSK